MAATSASTARVSLRGKAPISRFSCTVRLTMMRRPSGTRTRLWRTRRLGGQDVISVPSSSTRPPLVGSSPMTAFSSDDLPAPLAPSTATISPGSTASETPRSAWTRPYRTWTSWSSRRMALLRRRGFQAEIGLSDQRIFADVAGRPLRDLAAEIEHDHLLAQRTDEMHVVLEQEQGDAVCAAGGGEAFGQRVGYIRIGSGRGLMV